MSHDFIWDALHAIALPAQYISVLHFVYNCNKQFMRVDGQLLDSLTVYSGVRQGCPRSTLVFARCADILLTSRLCVDVASMRTDTKMLLSPVGFGLMLRTRTGVAAIQSSPPHLTYY